MDIHIFKENEIVQVLDVTTHIWELAKILGFITDWSAKVKWVDWSSIPPIVIEVPATLREKGRECWNIRKFQKRTLEHNIGVETRPARRQVTVQQPGNYRPFTGNPAKLPRYVQVIFMLFF